MSNLGQVSKNTPLYSLIWASALTGLSRFHAAPDMSQLLPYPTPPLRL